MSRVCLHNNYFSEMNFDKVRKRQIVMNEMSCPSRREVPLTCLGSRRWTSRKTIRATEASDARMPSPLAFDKLVHLFLASTNVCMGLGVRRLPNGSS